MQILVTVSHCCPPLIRHVPSTPASPAFQYLLELNAHELASGLGLDSGDDTAQPLISHLLKQPQQARLEEHLKARG